MDSEQNIPEGWGKISLEVEKTGIKLEKTNVELIKKMATQLFTPPKFDESGEYRTNFQWKGKDVYSVYTKRDYKKDLHYLEHDLSKSGVKEGELVEFVGIVEEIKDIFAPNDWQDSNKVKFWIKVAKDIDQARNILKLAKYWKSSEQRKILSKKMQETTEGQSEKVFKELCGQFVGPTQPLPDLDMGRAVIDTMLSYYELEQGLPKSLPKRGIDLFRHGVELCCFRYHEIDSANELINTLRQTAKEEVSDTPFENFAYAISYYTSTSGLSADVAENFRKHLLPAIAREDDNVAILRTSNNSWSMGRGEFAIGEYTCHLYSFEPTPQFINELMLINSEIPTSIAHVFEQNRRDGSSLTRVVGLQQLKEAIHDQRPFNHDVISAMVDFYDDKITQEKLLEVISKHDYLSHSEEFKIVVRNKNTYEEIVEENIQNERKKVSTIDVLRRLSINTAPIPNTPPKTTYETLNTRLISLSEKQKESSEYKAALAQVLLETNRILEEMFTEKKVGVSSQLITALGYIDQSVAEVIRSIPFEEQVRAYRSEWFGEAVKFHDLTTNSEKYDSEKTSEFIRKMQQEHTLGAYGLLGEKVILDMDNLRRLYKDKGRGRWGEMLWSGNLSHEFISIKDLKTPSTPEGVAYKQKFLDGMENRLKGD